MHVKYFTGAIERRNKSTQVRLGRPNVAHLVASYHDAAMRQFYIYGPNVLCIRQ